MRLLSDYLWWSSTEISIGWITAREHLAYSDRIPTTYHKCHSNNGLWYRTIRYIEYMCTYLWLRQGDDILAGSRKNNPKVEVVSENIYKTHLEASKAKKWMSVDMQWIFLNIQQYCSAIDTWLVDGTTSIVMAGCAVVAPKANACRLP